MNETEKKLNIMLEGLIELAGQTTALASEQVPLVLQEVITWCLIRNYLILFILTIIFMVVCFLLYRLLKDITGIEDINKIGYDKGCMVAFLATFALAIFCYSVRWPIHEVLKVTFAPKLYLLEYLKGLL